MPLNDIYTALQQSLTGTAPNQSIDLYAAATTQPALSALTQALQLLGITGAYSLTGVTLTQNVSDVVLTGNGRWGLAGALSANVSPIRAQLVGTSAGSVNTFRLALTLTSPTWTFSTSFSVLPVCQVAGANNAVGLAPSFLIGLPMNLTTLTASSAANAVLKIAGQLPLSTALQPWADFFAPWPLRAAGTLTLPATLTDPPAMEITALAPSANITSGPVGIQDIGLRLAVYTGLDPEIDRVTALSSLDFVGTVPMGGTNSMAARLSMPLLAMGTIWKMTAQVETDDEFVDPGLQQVAALLGVPPGDLLVPNGFLNFLGFYLSEVEVALTPPSATAPPKLHQAVVALGSKKIWKAPIPYVQVQDVGTRWLVGFASDGLTPAYLSGSVYGSVRVGGTPPPTLVHPSLLRYPPALDDNPQLTSFSIDIVSYIPSFVILAELGTDDVIPIGDAFRYFFLNDSGPPTTPGMAVTDFRFEADPRSQTYTAAATMTMEWTVPLGVNVSLKLVDLNLRIAITQGEVTGGISGDFLLVGGAAPGGDEPYFNVAAEYTGKSSLKGWTFTASLYPSSTVSLTSLVSNFLGITPPTGLPTLSLDALSGSFSTGSGAYAFSGTVVGRWSPTVFGSTLAISAAASVDLASDGTGIAPEGSLLGTFSINRIALTVGINLKADEPTYLLKVQFGDPWISATTAWRDDKKFPKHQIVTLQLGGVTLGAMLEYLVNLAAPTLQFQLDPPWDVLNRIDLSRFQFTLDPTENSVDFVFTANADLIFVNIVTIGVRYVRTGGEPDVSLLLTGRFLTKTYTFGNELSWNVLTEPPPAVPGGGNSLLELRYLGVGQRVGLKDPLPDTVRETIARLRADMKPPVDPNQNPLDQSALEFRADSEWLIGLDARILDTLDLSIVFNDPRLYGLAIALSGERAGSLAGFSFQILYKKITDDIGMFRVELQIPEAFRHIELGEVSITLGIIVVEIYTNGNFMVDLGFPYNRNFERSFTVQVFPFIGRGGIYFGLLNGSTSRRVPAIVNGNFDPVLELGIGLAVGVGKEIVIGPLSGGIFVEVQVIFQGVLAWFNPVDSAIEASKYFWVQGTAAIHGKLYGKVDFKVIKVQVAIEAWAQVSVTFEAYKAALFRLNVGVSVEAEVTIFFISVSFSYDTQLDVSFTVGTDQPTPWILAANQSAPTQRRLQSNILPALSQRRTLQTQRLRAQHMTAVRNRQKVSMNLRDTDSLTWNPALTLFTDSPRQKSFTMLPAFLVAQPAVGWSTAPTPPTAQYRVCFLLTAPNGIAPSVLRAGNVAAAAATRSAEMSAEAATTAELTADTLIEAFLRWSISAVTGSPGNDSTATVTAGQLQVLTEEMSSPQTADTAFSLDNLQTLFTTNLWMELAAIPGAGPTIGGLAVPIPPFLTWTSAQAGSCNFATQTKVGPLYEWGANAAANAYFPLQEPATTAPVDDPATYESYASYIFRDWCLMVAKAAVQFAQEAMTAWPVTPAAATSLAQVAAGFPTVAVTYTTRAGDTLDSVAASLGVSVAGLVALNPGLAAQLKTAAAGSSLQVMLGISPEAVAWSNAGVVLLTGVMLTLGDIDTQVVRGDTLNGIATRFNLSSAAALFTDTLLAANTQLLNPGSTFTSVAASFTPPTAFTALLTAAVFFPRFYGSDGIPYVDWYAQTVFDFNATATLATWVATDPLPVDIVLQVPATWNDTDPSHALTYTTVAGDTLNYIGAALALEQNFATGAAPVAAWAGFRDAVVASGATMSIPASPITILPGESVLQLSNRTLLYAGSLTGLLNWIGDATILNPLALITVPGVSATTGTDGATLEAIATRFGLNVTDLGERVATAVLLAANVPLSIASLPVQGIDALVTQVLAGDAPAQISGMSSRFLLAGLSLPAPETNAEGKTAATGPLTSINDLTGQQFVSPAPDMTQPAVTALAVTVTVNAGAGWIVLADAARAGEDGALPQATSANHRARFTKALRPGTIVTTGGATQLDFTYTNQQLQDSYPASAFEVTPAAGPTALPLAGQSPRTYGLDHRIEVQSPLPLPIPQAGSAALTGSASVWPFPESMLQLAQAANTLAYDIVMTVAAPDGSSPPDTVQSSTFATLLPFTLRRMGTSEQVFEVLGANTQDRQTLLQLWLYIAAESTPATQAFLLVAPAPNAGNPNGLGVLQIDASLTYLIKTNQSTETTPGARLRRQDAATDAAVSSANFSALASFLQLLWEASITGGSGYFFGFSTTDSKGLPATAFDAQGNITLYVLTIAGAQQALAPAGRTLLPFNNCAAFPPQLDASATALWVEAAGSGDLMSVAIVPPGNIGYSLLLPKPQSTDTLATLFSLATCEVPTVTDSPFVMPASGLPTPPSASDGQQIATWKRHRRRRLRRAGVSLADDPSTNDYWLYEQVLPIARFGPPSFAPASPALASPLDDPYRGIGNTALKKAGIQLGFADVFGNRTAPASGTGTATPPPGAIDAPTGYTDTLLGIASWPATTSRFDIAKPVANVLLTVTFSAQPAPLTPAPGLSPLAAIEAATRQAETYKTVYFQLSQPGVSAQVLTSLAQTAGVPTPLNVDIYPLWAFAAAQYVAANAASLVVPVYGTGTLQEVTTTYGVSFADIATANAKVPIVALLGSQTLTVPALQAFAEGDTANSIVASVAVGWPAPADGAALLALQQNANVLPLRVGTLLLIPATDAPVPVVMSPALTLPLAGLAAQAHTTAGMLATDNATTTGILAGNFMFIMDGLGVTVGVTTIGSGTVATFADVVLAFSNAGVQCTVADVGAENGATAGMLNGGVTLTSLHYVAQPNDTLQTNLSGATTDKLSTLNSATSNLFDAGASIYLGDFSPAPSTGAASAETLREFADRYATPPELLLSANPAATLPATSQLVVPGTVTLPSTAIWVPYSIAGGDTLDAIATLFATAPGSGTATVNLAVANQFLPDLLAANQTVAVTAGGTSYSTTTVAGQSLNALLLALQAQSASITFAEVVGAIASTGGYLAPGALLLCPSAKLAGAAGSVLTPAAAVAVYGVDTVAFAEANCGVLGLIAANVSLTDAAKTVTLITGAQDTFNSLVSRFAAAGHTVGITEIVSTNAAVAFLAGGAAALLPPAPAVFTVSLGTAAGPFAAPNFRLSVTLRLARPAAVISPEFITTGGDGPVERADCSVPAPITPDNSGTSLPAFAAAFEAAIPTLRLATGNVPDSDADLWVVDFGQNGISNVTIAPAVDMGSSVEWPRFIALRPLYQDMVNRAGVTVPVVQTDGTLQPGPTLDFQGIDVEVWARRFLADMDLFLTGPNATGLYANTAARATLATVLANKATLAAAIPKGLMTVLAVTDPGATAGLVAASAAMTQQFGVNLSSAYGISSIVQYQATVASPWIASAAADSVNAPARLAGNATNVDTAGDTSQPFTLSNAKIALDQASSPVTFLLRLADLALSGPVSTNFDYGFLDLEFDLQTISAAPGYVSSKWLAFVPRIDSSSKPASVHFNLGSAPIPIPLRAYPPQPVLLGQTADATQPVAVPTLASTPLWTFGVSYSHEHLAQDEVVIRTTFNLTPPALLAKQVLTAGDVATSLARYITAADALWALLAGVADPSLNIAAATLANAANSFATLSTEVAMAWSQKTWTPHTSDTWAAGQDGSTASTQVYSFQVRIGYKLVNGVEVLDTLTLAADQTQPGPTNGWPNAFCQSADGSLVTLTAGTPAGTVLVYKFPDLPLVLAGPWPRITLEWPSLNVSTITNARASMAVRRNQNLLGETGPATNSGFLYQTPLIDAPQIMTPLLIWTQRIDITALGATVAEALQGALQTLFGGATGLSASFAVQYGFELMPPTEADPEGLVTYLPVTLLPNQTLTAQTAQQIASALDAWRSTHPPAPARAEWVFALSLCSPAAMENKQILLILERLIFSMPSAGQTQH